MGDKQTATKSIILRVLFIIAIVVVIIILAFAIIRFIPMAFSSFASVSHLITSPFKNNTVEVTVNDSNLTDSEKFLLSWKYDPKVAGSYKLTYKCVDELRINAVLKDGEQTILCNTQYTLPAENSIELEANFGQKETFVDLPLEVSFIDDSNKNIEARGETLVTIQNSANPTPVGDNAGATITSEDFTNNNNSNSNSGSNSTTNSTSGGTSNTNNNPNNLFDFGNDFVVPNTPADLAIINADPIDDLTVQFVIKNIGGQNTGNWTLSYTVPGESAGTSLEPSFRPGDVKKYTLRFDNGTPKGTTVITADSTNKIAEASESNNKATIKIDGGNSSGSSSNNDFDSNDDADFKIEDLEVGRMNGSKFVEDDEINDNDDAAIRFTVVNRGGEETEDWRFEVKNAPYDNNSDDEFRSKEYNSLNPGESIEVIVEFENPDEGRYSIHVEVDSEDDTDEESESNNTDSDTLEVNN